MSREPDQSDDRSTAPDKVLEANNLRALIERSESLQRLALEEKYGPDVRLVAEDDDKLKFISWLIIRRFVGSGSGQNRGYGVYLYR
jgi:hypothetical protein